MYMMRTMTKTIEGTVVKVGSTYGLNRKELINLQFIIDSIKDWLKVRRRRSIPMSFFVERFTHEKKEKGKAYTKKYGKLKKGTPQPKHQCLNLPTIRRLLLVLCMLKLGTMRQRGYSRTFTPTKDFENINWKQWK